MCYKTILVHVDESRRVAERSRVAAALALASGAHLSGIAFTGVSRFLSRAVPMESQDPGIAATLDRLRKRARAGLEAFEQVARAADIVSCDSFVVDDEASAGMALYARCSDLLVIGQTDVEEPSPSVMANFPELVLINAGKPVLVVPNRGRFDVIGNRVLVGWDGSLEAARAVSAALPVLKRAALVRIAVFDSSSGTDGEEQQPAAGLLPFLSRHGVNADVVREHSRTNIGQALLSCAKTMAADLMVIGAYGHSRFREVLLGGVTRTVLDAMWLPVLMSH